MNADDLTPLLAPWPVGRATAVVVDGSGTILATGGDTAARLPLASVTKALFAWAALLAVEEGAFGLDDPAPEPAPPGATVADLLAHSSGLGPTREDPVVAAGSRRIYSNFGFDLLGGLLEETTGLGAAEYLHEGVCRPLGLSGTTLDGSPAHAGTGTAADLARLATEALHPTLLHPDTVARALAPHRPELAGVLPGYGRQDPNPWGLGWELRGTKTPHWTGTANSPRTAGHFGRSGTFLWVDPETGLGCVVLTDTPFGPWAIEAWPEFNDEVLRRYAPVS